MSDKYALLIGTSRYTKDMKSFPVLGAPENDINAFYKVLCAPEIGGFPKENITILSNAGKRRTEKSIENFFTQCKADDLLIFYFSGHGVLEHEGNLYFVVTDTERDSLAATSVAADFVKRFFNKCKAGKVLLILDCCYSARFIEGAKAAELGSALNVTEYLEDEETTDDVSGHYILTATSGLQLAWENEQRFGQAVMSVFTSFLTDGLKTGEADTQKKGYITVEDLFYFAQRKVRLWAKSKKNLVNAKVMEPEIHLIRGRGNFSIASNPYYTLELVTLSTDNGIVKLQNITLFESMQPTQQRQLPLFCNLHENNLNIIIIKRFADGEQKVVFKGIAHVLEQPFYITCDVGQSNLTLDVKGEGCTITKRSIDSQKIHIPSFHLENSTFYNINVTFLLDGTMSHDDWYAAQEFIVRVAEKLEVCCSAPIKFACIVYTEYSNFVDGRKYYGSRMGRTWPTSNATPTFGTAKKLEHFLHRLNNVFPDEEFNYQDICDAMEDGLKATLLIPSIADIYHVVLVGNSPPHPNFEEFRQYGLLQFTVDEFDAQHWSIYLEELKQKSVHLSSCWIETYDLRYEKNLLSYAKEVWYELNERDDVLTIKDDASLEQTTHKLVTRIIQTEKIKSDRAVRLPWVKDQL
jgi:hypothetical protein